MAPKKHSDGRPKLAPKQRKFINEYLKDLNATQAAIRAGYSKKTAHSQGPRLLENVGIKKEINKKQEKLSKKTEITQERVLNEYAKIAFLDPTLFFDSNGKLFDIHKIPKESSSAIGGIDVSKRIVKHGNKDGSDDETEYIKKIKLWDKIKALDALSKHLGLFEADNKQRGTDALAILLEKIACQNPPKPKSDDSDKPK